MFNQEKYPNLGQAYKLTDGDKDLVLSMTTFEMHVLSQGSMAGSLFSYYVDRVIDEKKNTSLMADLEDYVDGVDYEASDIKREVLAIIGSRKTLFEKMLATQELLECSKVAAYLNVRAYRESGNDARNDVELEYEYSVKTMMSLERLFRHLNAICVSFTQYMDYHYSRLLYSMGEDEVRLSRIEGKNVAGGNLSRLQNGDNMLVSLVGLPERYYL